MLKYVHSVGTLHLWCLVFSESGDSVWAAMSHSSMRRSSVMWQGFFSVWPARTRAEQVIPGLFNSWYSCQVEELRLDYNQESASGWVESFFSLTGLSCRQRADEVWPWTESGAVEKCLYEDAGGRSPTQFGYNWTLLKQPLCWHSSMATVV